MTSPGGQSGQPSWDPSGPAGSVPPPTGTDGEATSDYPVYEYPAIEEPGPPSAPWQQGPPPPAPQVPPQPPTGGYPMPPGPLPMPPGPPVPVPPGPPPGFYGAPPAGPYGPPPGMAAPGYLPPGGYLPPPMYSSYPAPRSNDGIAIGSLVSSLVALPLYFICFVFGPAGSVLGIVLGIVALAQAKGRPRSNGRTMAIAGIVIGAVTLVVALVGFVLLFDWASRQEPTL